MEAVSANSSACCQSQLTALPLVPQNTTQWLGGVRVTFAMAAAASAAPAPESSDATTAAGPQVVLVTGGTGLVGQGIRAFVEGAGAKDAPEGETWYYASSKDGDLR